MGERPRAISRNRLHILLSAYECDPNRGSEWGKGWRWALELGRLGHRVWILTKSTNRANVDAAISELPRSFQIKALYYELRGARRVLHRLLSVMIPKKSLQHDYVHYRLWQAGALRYVKDVHELQRFELVHHVTIGSIRTPSRLGRLGPPFVFGPVGGGNGRRCGYGRDTGSEDGCLSASVTSVTRWCR